VYSSAATEVSIFALHLAFVLRYVMLRRRLFFVSIGAAWAIIVSIVGINWEHQINATLFHVFSFSILSLILFSTGFLFYRLLGSKIGIA
jgi:hypothetical protein